MTGLRLIDWSISEFSRLESIHDANAQPPGVVER